MYVHKYHTIYKRERQSIGVSATNFEGYLYLQCAVQQSFPKSNFRDEEDSESDENPTIEDWSFLSKQYIHTCMSAWLLLNKNKYEIIKL